MTSDFYVFLSDSPFTSTDLSTTLAQAGVSNYLHSGFSGPTASVGATSINVNRSGRYVRVQLAGTGSLALAEVQVWSAAAKVEWLVTDHLGTPRMLADKTGSLAGVSRHDYLPFGEEVFESTGGRTTSQGYAGDSTRQKFTQKERDNETGLDYFVARYYASTQGRFTAADEFNGEPVELFAEAASANPTFYADLRKPQSLNKYQYAFNNPLRYVDPDGHCSGEPDEPCSKNLSVEQVTNIVFNETQSLSGSKQSIDTMHKNVAHAVINGDNDKGENRPRTGSTTVSGKLKETATYKETNEAVKCACQEHKEGTDPTNGGDKFNLRPNDNQKPFQGADIQTHDGPFVNSYPSGELPKGSDVYVNTYKDPPKSKPESTKPAPRKPEPSKRKSVKGKEE